MYEERNRNVQKLQDDYWLGIRLTPIRLAILTFLGIFVIIFTLMMVIDLLFGVGYGSWGEPVQREKITWADIPDRLPEYLFMATGVGFFLTILLFFISRAEASDKRKGFNPITTQVCTKCNKVKADDGIYTCDCGGEYILITKMKWVEPEIDDVEKD